MNFNRSCLIVMVCTMSVYSQFSLTGVVKKTDGSTVSSIEVVLQDTTNAEIAHTITDNVGAYTIPFSQALTKCNIMVRVNSMINVGTLGVPKDVFYTAYTKVPLAGSTTKDITLPRYYKLSGKVVNNQGDPLSNVKITAKKWNGYESTPWDNCFSSSDGSYELYQESGGVKCWVTAPSGYSAIEPEFTVTSDTVINLVLSKPYVLHGTVRDYSGNVAANAIVSLQLGYTQIDSLVHQDGSYTVPLQGGTYKVRLRSNSMNRVADSPIEFDTTVSENLVISSDTIVDLTLQRFFRVSITVKDNDGIAVDSAIIRSVKGSGVGQLPRDMSKTDDDGKCTLFVTGGTSEITLTPKMGSALFEHIQQHAISSDTALVIILPKGVPCKGKVLRADSSHVKNITVTFQSLQGPTQYETKTDSTGAYFLLLQPGAYKVRIRNYSCQGNAIGVSKIEGLPCELEYTVLDSAILTDSFTTSIVLPEFPIMKGIVKTISGQSVQGARIYCRSWKYGYEQPPHDETYSSSDGSYSLVLNRGINKVWVIPPVSQSTLQPFDFIDNVDSSRVRDITIPDQAKGITRIQPSVISTGETGSVMINGINVNFTRGSVSVDLGTGITVSNIKVISDITITADIKVSDTAISGTRDIILSIGNQNAVGAGLLSITPPAEAKISLVNGETTKEIRISDGTGTEVMIPAGTTIIFPHGSDSTIRYIAPLLTGTDTAKLINGEFTDIQRELFPSGLKVGENDSIVVVSHYKNQDIEGLDETSLVPFYFIEDSANGKTSAGDSLEIVARDTSKNTLTFAMKHFSIYRIATLSSETKNLYGSKELSLQSSSIINLPEYLRSATKITLFVSERDNGSDLTVTMYNLAGRRVSFYSENLVSGYYSFTVKSLNGYHAAYGTYIMRIRIGHSIHMRRVTIGR